MNPNVDVVDIVAINELAPAGTVNLEWNIPMSAPDNPTARKGTIELLADVISEMIGTVTIPNQLFYEVGGPAEHDPAAGAIQVEDPALDGLDYNLDKRGVGPLEKGIDWQNDVVGGGFRLLIGGPFTVGEVYIVTPKPEISDILASPDAIGRLVSDIAIKTTDTILGAGDFRKLIVIQGAKNITLPLCSAFPVGIGLLINTAEGPHKQCTIKRQGADIIFSNAGGLTEFYLGQREFAKLVTNGTTWFLVDQSPAVFGRPNIGGWGWMAGLNQLLGDGGEYLRADYPRVMNFLNALAAIDATLVKNAAEWSVANTFWGWGNGSTTFRTPKLNGQFPRALDMGAGIDADRLASGLQNKPGSQQEDAFKAHEHNAGAFNKLLQVNGVGTAVSVDNDPTNQQPNLLGAVVMAVRGGTESRGKNVGFYPYINI